MFVLEYGGDREHVTRERITRDDVAAFQYGRMVKRWPWVVLWELVRGADPVPVMAWRCNDDAGSELEAVG